MHLVGQIFEAVNRYWAEDVQVLGIWEDGPGAACVVYRRTVDPAVLLGCRPEFHSNAADGTIEGFARDIAINLAEPIGTAKSRQDQYGIVWLAIPDDRHTPEPPPDVVRILSDK
jgi:hypothetical protein